MPERILQHFTGNLLAYLAPAAQRGSTNVGPPSSSVTVPLLVGTSTEPGSSTQLDVLKSN